MSPGQVDLKVVGDRLHLAATCLEELRALPAASLEEFLADRRNARAAEALLHRVIESLFDVARHLLAKAFGLAPLEYREVARISLEKGLITDHDLGRRFGLVAGFRNRLAHHYEEVTPEELFALLTGDLGDLHLIAAALREAAARLAQTATT